MSQSSLGLIETRSFPVIVRIADGMLKSSGVSLIGFEKTQSGYCTAVVRGGIADVRIAIEAGAEVAQEFEQEISSLVIPRPMPNLDVVLPISSRLSELAERNGYSRVSRQAVGLLETRGFPAMVGACDAMLKTAEVQLVAYETIGNGLCTGIVRGSVANVAIAIEAGMYEADRIGELNAIAVIPRPLDDLEQVLPVASCFISEPVQIPVMMPEKQTEEVHQLAQDSSSTYLEEPLNYPPDGKPS